MSERRLVGARCNCGSRGGVLNNVLTRGLTVVACVLAFGASATVALADDGSAGPDAQLLDVTKQIGGIQHTMAQLSAHGQWARPGKLLAAAACGYGVVSPVFAAWGDQA